VAGKIENECHEFTIQRLPEGKDILAEDIGRGRDVFAAAGTLRLVEPRFVDKGLFPGGMSDARHLTGVVQKFGVDRVDMNGQIIQFRNGDEGPREIC
jgi:hypothetical protein